MLKFSPSWRAVQEALRDVKGRSDLEAPLWERTLCGISSLFLGG